MFCLTWSFIYLVKIYIEEQMELRAIHFMCLLFLGIEDSNYIVLAWFWTK